MAKTEIPVTTAVRFLRDERIPFIPHHYPYEEHGGTAHAAAMLNVDEHWVVKTLVMETDEGRPLLVLMHGDCEVSIKQMARILGVKRVAPCDPTVAGRHTGYRVGGTSPFGTRTHLPVYVEESIFALPRIYVNGGKRGFLVEIDPCHLKSALAAVGVTVAVIAP